MRRVTGPAALDVPDELVDRTTYAFESQAPAPSPTELPPKADRIRVAWEALPERITPEMLVAHRRARIEEFSGVTSSITEGQIAGPFVQASALHAAIDGGDERFSVLFAAFRWSPLLMGSILFDSVTRTNAGAEFAHVTESVRPASSTEPAAPGFVLRYAGDVALELPAGFRWPKTHFFTTADDASRLMITSEDAEPEPIDFDALVSVEGLGDSLHVDALAARDVALGGGLRGAESSFRALRRDASGAALEARSVRRITALMKDRSWLSILLVEDAAAPVVGEERFGAMAQSLVPSGQIP